MVSDAMPRQSLIVASGKYTFSQPGIRTVVNFGEFLARMVAQVSRYMQRCVSRHACVLVG